jgi:hypothetical protein
MHFVVDGREDITIKQAAELYGSPASNERR